MTKRPGTGLEWAAAQARHVIHDNDVERLKELLAEYPALLSCSYLFHELEVRRLVLVTVDVAVLRFSRSSESSVQGLRVLINRTSLSQTVDAINAAHFVGRMIAANDRGQAARWIAGRQGLPGAYGNTFAGFPSERSRGIVLFTGERIASASARHVLGEEASRALRQLRVRDSKVTRALENADNGLMRCLARAAEDPRNRNPGLYCCGKCSVGLWRNLLAGGLDRHEERLRRGALYLRSMRNGEHQWRRFPFWYTVLALSEMNNPEAKTELTYAAPALERAASRAMPLALYARRRHELAVRTLNRL